MFKDILELIVNKTNNSLYIKGKGRTVRGAAKFRSINMPNDPYIKVTFDDDSGLILLINDGLIFYSPIHLGFLNSVADNQVGLAKSIEYNNEMFTLVNKNDYQFVTQLIKGDLLYIEGECRFSDYMTRDESKMLSLGWNSYTKKRDDAYAELLNEAEIEIK